MANLLLHARPNVEITCLGTISKWISIIAFIFKKMLALKRTNKMCVGIITILFPWKEINILFQTPNCFLFRFATKQIRH